MNTRSVTVIYLALCTLIIGAIIVEPMAATPTIRAKVLYLPWRINLKHPPEWGIYAFIIPQRPFRAWNIDPETIRLEGVLAPESTVCWCFLFIARFDPSAVLDIVWMKIYHLGLPPGRRIIRLKIAGQFRDGTPFEGTGKIWVKIPPTP